MTTPRKKRILMISSGGGHLEQALECLEAFPDCDVAMAIYAGPGKSFSHPGINRVYKVRLFGGIGFLMVLTLFVNIFEFIRILLRERPDIIFSTGAEVTITPFIMGKLFFRTQNIFIETAFGGHGPTQTARWVYRWSNLFLVQWPHQVDMLGPKARYEGRLL